MRTTTRKIRTVGTAVAAALLLWGCETETESVDITDDSGAMTVEQMGRLGAQVYLEPERAEEIVEAAGMTPMAFEERIRSITNDRGRSLTYARAFEAEVAAARTAASEEEEGAPGDDETASGDTGGGPGAPDAAPSAP